MLNKPVNNLLALGCLLALSAISIIAWKVSAEAAPAEAIPISSAAPWQEVSGSVATAGEVISYTFSADAGQIATVDLLTAADSLLAGEVRLQKESNGAQISDSVYGPAVGSFGPMDAAGLTAALPETGNFLIVIDPVDGGDGATGDFTLRFNLIESSASTLVDDDLNECPSAATGFVRAAARATFADGTVEVCAGVYTSTQRISLEQPGVTFRGGGPEDTVISAEDDVTLQLGATDLTIDNVLLRGGTRRIVEQRYGQSIDRLTVANCHIEGLVTALELTDAVKSADDVAVRDCTIQVHSGGSHNRYGILLWGERAQILDNVINTISSGKRATYANAGINVTGDDAEIRSNTVGDDEWPPNTHAAIHVQGNRATIEENGIAGYTIGISVNAAGEISSTATVDANHLQGDTVGGSPTIGISVTDVGEARISANLISGSPDLARGILLSSSGGRVFNNRVTISRFFGLQYSDPNDVRRPVSFVNNTVVHENATYDARGVWINYEGVLTQSMTLPITVTNNLLVAPAFEPDSEGFCGVDSSRPLQSISNNLVAGYNIALCNEAAVDGAGAHVPPGDAGLDEALRLQATSKAVDAGTSTGAPPVDFEGDPRPANAAVDIGADESVLPVDLSVVKETTSCGFVDSDLPYEIAITNFGPGAATDVELVEILPDEATPLSIDTSQGSCLLGRATSCTLGTLAPGEKVTITLTIEPTAAVALTNKVTITSTESDLEMANNEDSVIIQIADLPSTAVDLAPTALEVSQAIQDLDNSVPIVEQKPTMARLYIQSDASQVENVGALLYGWRDEEPLSGSPLSPLSPFSCIAGDADGPERGDVQQTHLFALPSEWRNGQVTLTAVVNPGSPGPIPETNSSNNEITEVVTFREQPPICIRTYRVSALDQDGAERLVPMTHLFADKDGFIARAHSLLPTPEMRIFPESTIISRWAPFKSEQGFAAPFEKMTPLVQWQILEALWEKDQLSNDPAECDQADARTHYLGMVHPAASETIPTGFSGRATGISVGRDILIGDQLVIAMHTDDGDATYESPTGGQTIAHELGHNYGRPHPPCDNEGPPRDKNYPYEDCTLGPAEPDAFYGLDMVGQSAPVAIAPTEAGDLMSYADPNWISDYQWRNIGAQLCSQSDSPCNWSTTSAEALEPAKTVAPPQFKQAITETESVVILAGVITDAAQFGSIHRLATDHLPQEKLVAMWNAQLPVSTTTDYEVNILGETGELLYTQPFTPLISTSHQSDLFTFGVLVPDQAEMATIQIAYQGSELISRTVSANSPTVTIHSPTGGEVLTDTIQLAWQGNDADGDGLTYVAQYSADMGQTWRVLQADVTTTSLTVNAQTLAGSLNQSLIRIIANDGVNTGSAQSNPFSLAKRAPIVGIQKPEAGTVFDTGLPITLSGSAFDPEDGWLSNEALTWSVERLGIVGTGREVRLTGLAAGLYQLTLEAVDSEGQTGADTITIQVVSNPGPQMSDVYLPIIVR